MLEHKDEIANFISLNHTVLNYHSTESEFSEQQQLNEVSPIRIKFNVIRHTKDLIKHMPNIFLARLISEDNDKRHSTLIKTQSINR
ncbi:hypothetical protein ACVPOQ_00975 [Staphylococcus aureus]